MMSLEVDGRHTGIGLLQTALSFQRRILWLRVGHEIDGGVEVGHTYRLITVIGRSTIDTVAHVRAIQSSAVLRNRRRNLLMRAQLIPIIGQHLSEEQIVVRPDRIELCLPIVLHVCVEAFIDLCRNFTTGIAEVTIGKAFFNVTTSRQIDIISTRRAIIKVLSIELAGLRD